MIAGHSARGRAEGERAKKRELANERRTGEGMRGQERPELGVAGKLERVIAGRSCL